MNHALCGASFAHLDCRVVSSALFEHFGLFVEEDQQSRGHDLTIDWPMKNRR